MFIFSARATCFYLAIFFAQVTNASDINTNRLHWQSVQEAVSGTLEGPDQKHLTLTLRKVRQFITVFSDRPNRVALNVPNKIYFDAWDQNFLSDSPNATLSYRTSGDPRPRNLVLTLSSPTYISGRKTVVYKASIVHNNLLFLNQ